MKKNKPSNHLNAALIMQRLPFHRQLSLSQSLLIKCSPIWQKWAEHNLSADTANTIGLSHFQQGELILHCENAISATQIKQQQQTLLHFFEKEGIKEIKQITVRISNNQNHLTNFSTKKSDDPLKPNTETVNRAVNMLDNNALNCIKSVHKSTSNEALSESLHRLIITLEKNQS